MLSSVVFFVQNKPIGFLVLKNFRFLKLQNKPPSLFNDWIHGKSDMTFDIEKVV